MECVDLSLYACLEPLSNLDVALRMECVDLSIALNRKNKLLLGRTPHGVRGFKCKMGKYFGVDVPVALRMECVDLSLKNPLMSQSSTVALRMECVDLSLRKKYRC